MGIDEAPELRVRGIRLRRFAPVEEERKKKIVLQYNPMNQSKLQANTCSLHKARENFSSASKKSVLFLLLTGLEGARDFVSIA